MEPEYHHSLLQGLWALHSHIMLQMTRRFPFYPRLQLLSTWPPGEETTFAEQRPAHSGYLCQSRSPQHTRGSHYHGYYGASRAAAINQGYRSVFCEASQMPRPVPRDFNLVGPESLGLPPLESPKIPRWFQYVHIGLHMHAEMHSLSDLSLNFLTRDWTQATAVKAPSPHHWTARKFPSSNVYY